MQLCNTALYACTQSKRHLLHASRQTNSGEHITLPPYLTQNTAVVMLMLNETRDHIHSAQSLQNHSFPSPGLLLLSRQTFPVS